MSVCMSSARSSVCPFAKAPEQPLSLWEMGYSSPTQRPVGLLDKNARLCFSVVEGHPGLGGQLQGLFTNSALTGSRGSPDSPPSHQ